MKNKKCILIFTLIIAFLLVLVANVQATNDNPLTILNVDTSTGNNEQANNAETNNTQNNNEITTPIVTTNNATNNTTNNTANISNTNLPQTGVAEDTALFVFIAVCVVSAIYAFIKVRNYKNI